MASGETRGHQKCNHQFESQSGETLGSGYSQLMLANNCLPMLTSYRVFQKTAQSLQHHNYATVHQSHAVFNGMFRKKFFT